MGFGTTKTPGKSQSVILVRFFRVLSCLLYPTDRQTTEFGSGRVVDRREDATRRSRTARTKHASARGDDGRVVRERERAVEEPDDETDDEADAESDGWTKG